MTFDASSAMRYAMDFTLAQTSIVGVTPYSVYVYQILNDQVDISDTDGYRVVLKERILIADGYRTYASQDGYLNPIVTQEMGESLLVSNGQITSNIIILGPLVFPYTANNFTGGIDTAIFQPPILDNNNIQVYVQLRGDALSPKGNFFDVDEIKTADMGGLSYYVVLKSNTSAVV